jgi:hypothetical protein
MPTRWVEQFASVCNVIKGFLRFVCSLIFSHPCGWDLLFLRNIYPTLHFKNIMWIKVKFCRNTCTNNEDTYPGSPRSSLSYESGSGTIRYFLKWILVRHRIRLAQKGPDPTRPESATMELSRNLVFVAVEATLTVFFLFFIFFKVGWQDATLFVYFSYFITYIHTFIQSHSYNTFIRHHSPGLLSISS